MLNNRFLAFVVQHLLISLLHIQYGHILPWKARDHDGDHVHEHLNLVIPQL